MMTNRKAAIVGAAVAMVLMICALLIGGLYEIQGNGPTAWRVNRITGTMTHCSRYYVNSPFVCGEMPRHK